MSSQSQSLHFVRTHYANLILYNRNRLPGIKVMRFLPARRYASAGLCDSDVSVRLSGRLSHAGIVPSRAKAGREMYTI